MKDLDLDELAEKYKLSPEDEEKRLKRVALKEKSRKELRKHGINPDSPLYRLPPIF